MPSSKYRKYLWLILIFGFIVFLPILFNGFAWDDIDFILKNPEVHQFDLLTLLGPNMFNSGLFYRPIPAIYFATLYSLFGQTAFFYHIIQLGLHLLDTYLLFFVFCMFFSEGVSFFLTLLFLIHPMNVESVAFIGSSQSELYFLPGISALLLARDENLSRNKLFWIVVLLALSAFTKETGILFFLLVVLYRYLFKSSKVKEIILGGAGIGILYSVFRIIVGKATYSTFATTTRIADLTLGQRLLNIPSIVFYYIKTFFYPVHLAVWQNWAITSATFANFILPGAISLVFLAIILFTFYVLYKKESGRAPFKNSDAKRHYYLHKTEPRFATSLFFTIWLLTGLGLILQIIPLDQTVSDRWFYFPIVGVLGLIGVGLQFLHQSLQKYKKIYIALAVILITLFSIRTFMRTFDWKNEEVLYMHDVEEKSDKDNVILLDIISDDLVNEKRYEDALPYALRSAAIYQTPVNLGFLGLIYLRDGQYEKSVAADTKVIHLFDPKILQAQSVFLSYYKTDAVLETTYIRIANAYYLANQPAKVVSFIQGQMLKKFPNDSTMYLFLGLAEYQLHNNKQAIEAIEQANKLYPDPSYNVIINKMKNNLPVKVDLLY